MHDEVLEEHLVHRVTAADRTGRLWHCLDAAMDRDLPDLPGPTPRLAFRRWRAADAEAVLDMYSRPEVYRFLGGTPSPVRDLDDARSRIDARNARTHGLQGIWAIHVLDDESPVGAALLVPLPRSDGEPSDVHEIGWHLHPDWWGRGLATEAAGAVIERARSAGLAEVRAVVAPENAASHAVCRRLGMTRAGLTREWYGVELVEHRLALRPDPAV
jgi:RimJ/RimL family protein N-acetyltransferase